MNVACIDGQPVTLARRDYFHHHDYTLHIGNAISIRLTEEEARSLHQELGDELGV